MSFIHDRRGQSVVIGTVILFGFLIVALAVYQAQVVPQENAQVEFEHSQEVEGDFVDLRNSILSAGRSGDARSTSVKLGTRYPQRTFFVNPPPATGQLSTTDERELRIENANVTGGKNVEGYWNEQLEGDDVLFNTRSLRYSPDYNEFRESPDLIYEHSFAVAEFDGAVLGRTGQTAVNADRNRVRLIELDGQLRASGVDRESIDPDTVSHTRRSVMLESENDNEPIILRLPTDVSAERADDLATAWERELGGVVEEITVEGEEVRIELDGQEGYRLELGKVGVGTGVSRTSEEYITKISSEREAAVVEVRDEYNNPVEDADVEIFVDGNSEEVRGTDEDGRIVYVPGSRQSAIRMEINDGDENWESVEFPAGTFGGDDDRGDDINPSDDDAVVLENVEVGPPGQRVVELEFRNRGTNDRTFEEITFALHYGNTQESFDITGPGSRDQEVTLRGGPETLDEPFVIPSGDTQTLTIEFDSNVQGDLIGLRFRDDINRRPLYLTGVGGGGGGNPGQGGGNP